MMTIKVCGWCQEELNGIWVRVSICPYCEEYTNIEEKWIDIPQYIGFEEYIEDSWLNPYPNDPRQLKLFEYETNNSK